MTKFDFAAHLQEMHSTKDETARIWLKKKLFDYYDTLSKEEQQAFKARLNHFLQQESLWIRNELSEIEKVVKLSI